MNILRGIRKYGVIGAANKFLGILGSMGQHRRVVDLERDAFW